MFAWLHAELRRRELACALSGTPSDSQQQEEGVSPKANSEPPLFQPLLQQSFYSVHYEATEP